MSAVAPAATRVLLLGGSSDIGLAIVRRLAGDGPVAVCLLGRDAGRLEAAAGALRAEATATATATPAPTATVAATTSATATAGPIDPILTVVADADDLAAHPAAIAQAAEQLGGLDIIVHAVGRLGGQAGLDADPAEAEAVLRTTFLGAGSLLWHGLRALREQDRGTLVVLSSVAAERPRAANAIYGAAKAGFDALAQGLADQTAGTGVRVLVVRPGFVTTKMTAGLKPTPLSSTPEQVASATVGALTGSAHTIWVPGVLRWVFAILRHLPRGLFRRLPIG
jgi:NAD(P)-dependent dehydrogenase (short-subunit alcohol dehydrogenase family)